MNIKFNLNQIIKVKLKKEGIDVLKNSHEEFYQKYKQLKPLPFILNVDNEGYTSFQMWYFMQKFGEYMTLGFDTPFHLDVIICDGEVINEHIKINNDSYKESTREHEGNIQ